MTAEEKEAILATQSTFATALPVTGKPPVASIPQPDFSGRIFVREQAYHLYVNVVRSTGSDSIQEIQVALHPIR